MRQSFLPQVFLFLSILLETVFVCVCLINSNILLFLIKFLVRLFDHDGHAPLPPIFPLFLLFSLFLL